MKQLNIVFDDDEHKQLVEKKGKMTWHDFILLLIKNRGKNGEQRKN